MSEAIPNFSEMHVDEPVLDELTEQYNELYLALDNAGSAQDQIDVLQRWDQLRRRIDTWGALTSLRFYQDTADPECKAARERMDELSPKLQNLAVELKKRLLNSPYRSELEARFGQQAFAIWEADARTFDPAIEEDLVEESKLTARYTELRSSAKLEYKGETYNLSSIARFASDPDRSVRHETSQLRWQFFKDHADEFDEIYDQLVKVRTRMAHKLGYDNYVGLGYDRMYRIDYDQGDVDTFRKEVERVVVPVARALREQQRRALGLDKLMAWDEGIRDPEGNPKPGGDSTWMKEQAAKMYAELHPELDGFFTLMRKRDLLDLDVRENKAGGGFCTGFPLYGAPYIFANFNGTKHDVTVLTHEMGHAFQVYSSDDQPLMDYLWPTMESCEIHSMSLEYLTFPWMELFFGDDAARFRRHHLGDNLLFLPYGVAVDHFQHLVYENPDATPAERRQFWQQMEARYLPDRDYGDLPHVDEGGLWQGQLHIYEVPFYYIDYTLAESCALQFWAQSEEDFADALERYVELCKRGGSLPFKALATSAGLRSPFEAGCLEAVVERARPALLLEESP